ncbi:T9SS type A sorting domain-containing protein, partial [candidate division KSB1 bacterium]|nr:T9SS type A sorting domain-containing protein [candidate division KSB1 bacterium]
LFYGRKEIPFDINADDGSFAVETMLHDGANHFVAAVDSGGVWIYSDTLTLSMGYNLRPQIRCWAKIAGTEVTLHARVVDNPEQAEVSYQWMADGENPGSFAISNAQDSVATVSLPASMPPGEYYFNVRVMTSNTDTVKARTFFTVDEDSVYAFDIRNDHAAWIDSAVVYGITPYIFVNRGEFRHISHKMYEIAEMGVNTIWLQPVFETQRGGQGYDIIDYFKIRKDLGGETELKELIRRAKYYNLRVLFDIPIKHTSFDHPYARHSIEYGESSHYYDFYQREVNNAPYSMHYKRNAFGLIHYFWPDLPNLNVYNSEALEWMMQACLYWVDRLDIDGYRFDAVWGLTAQNPDFEKELRKRLKSLKPELFLLAEDKAVWPPVFEERFDAAYDWTVGEQWVSHWSWQTDYQPNANPTIFNYRFEKARGRRLRDALTNNGRGYHPDAKIFRFMENNDTERFLPYHGLERTKMVAAFMFALPGIPLIFNGQTIGHPTHPYDTEFLFFNGFTIQSRDADGLFPFYQHLTRLRTGFPALYSDYFEILDCDPSDYILLFHRKHEDQNIITIMNMVAQKKEVRFSLQEQMEVEPGETLYLSDLISDKVIAVAEEQLDSVIVDMPGYTTMILLAGDQPVSVRLPQPDLAAVDHFILLQQNYPNPFNQSTVIPFTLARPQRVRIFVYDLLGRQVDVLCDQGFDAGEHNLRFDAADYPSGLYFYQLHAGDQRQIRKMTVVR